MGFSRQEYWSGLPFPSPVDHILSGLSTMPALLGWLHRAWLSLVELDKAVILVWLDWLVFCDYGFSVSALLQHLPSYLGFSYIGHGVSLHGCSSKAQPLSLPCNLRNSVDEIHWMAYTDEVVRSTWEIFLNEINFKIDEYQIRILSSIIWVGCI